MQAFSYVKAETETEVVALLASEGDGVRILSGGTDLIVQLREGRRQARLLVDVKGVPEANELTCDSTAGLRLGAAVPCYRICGDAAVNQLYPGLMDAIALIGGAAIQGRASVGGNLCNASPAADSIPALIVHRVVCVIAGPNGRREVPVEEFCTAPGATVLQHGEFLLQVRVLPLPARFGAGASVVLDESGARFVSARIALGAVAPTPLLVAEAGEVLAGKTVSVEAIAQAARIAQSAARPITDMRGTAAQRRHLAAVLTRRALVKAIERANLVREPTGGCA